MTNRSDQPRRAAIYTRISNDPTLEGLGVTRQHDDCVALAAQLGWEVVAHFDDNDLSAYDGRIRPGFEAMLDAMKQGQVDALICWHTDRLTRSMKDLERVIDIADAARISIKTVQGGDLDLATSAGRMVARILGSVARQEGEHKSERQKRANVQRAVAGGWLSANRCFGYDEHGEPVAEEAAAFRQAVSDVLGGKSIRKIATEWNAAGLKTTLAGRTQKRHGMPYTVTGEWNSPRVRRLLVNPRYAGLRTYRGKFVGPGSWTPLIDKETHDGLVAFLSDPSRVKCTSFERRYIGSGVYLCGRCGGPMRAQQPAKGQRGYACRDHAHLTRVGQPLDDFVIATVLARLAEPDAHVLIDTPEIDFAALQDQRAAHRAKLDKLTTLFTDDVIDDVQFRRGSTVIRAKFSVIDAQLASAVRTSPAAALIADGDVDKLWSAVECADRSHPRSGRR